MNKIFLILLLLIFNIVVFAGGHQGLRDKTQENGQSTILNRNVNPVAFTRAAAIDTSLRVPGMTTWWDYQTNGQNQRMLVVLGDTVIVAVQYSDSTNAQISAGRTALYQVSFDGGLTWLTDPVVVAPQPLGGAYPDIWPVVLNGTRTITISGRQFSSGSKGYAGVDVQLTAGSVTTNIVPQPGSDYFSCLLSGTKIGGVYQSGDTLFFRKYDYSTNTYDSRLMLALPTAEIDANGRKAIASSTDGQNVFAMWYVSTAGVEKLAGKLSTDGGNTFGTMTTVMPTTFVANGDETSPWFGMDLTYKPNSSTVVAAWCTQPVSSVKGYKILSWSPGVNGGNPVVVADHTNMPVLGDTAWVFNSTAVIQVGMTYISHPTLAYSEDGSTLACVFSSVQKDSIVYPAPITLLYNDVYISYSSNDGSTWSTPKMISSCTVDGDEIYPVLSKTGNTTGNFGLLYYLSAYPGSSSFSQTTAPVSRTYPIYTRVNPVTGNTIPIGINTISIEIPERFSLAQNYPNPFNPSTTIRFQLSKASTVNIKIFDVTGREIESIVKGEMVQAGTHEVKFDASKFASGVYFYSLEADNFKETKKMMLVK
ncbi:MAG: T9SS type A sorting domain-containing protein [Ignavibacteria bacterium]|nr:T9SS type A sorting domain-containing protein [Ignavibacteria bacterium]